MKLIPVEGKPDLARDPVTGAIVNINSNEINIARERKKKRKLQQQESQQLRNDVESLKQDMSDIKMLLAKLVENR